MRSHRLFVSLQRGTACALLALGLLVSGAVGLRAAEAANAAYQTPPPLSDRVAEELTRMQKIIDEKQWDTAIKTLKELLPDTDAKSYDRALVSFVLAQVYGQRGKADQGDYAAAIPLWETVVASPFFAPDRKLEFTLILAQLYLYDKKPDKAEEYARRWFETSPRPNPEGVIFYATLIFQRGQAEEKAGGQKAGEPAAIDRKAMEQVIAVTNRALRIFIKPHEHLFLLKAAALQSLERTAEAAEVLEMMVERYPQNRQYWQQLFASYMALQNPLRAALTIERAQRAGGMNTPADNLNLARLFFNMEQYNASIQVLSKGLHDGSITSERSSWELLGYAQQRVFKDMDAIKTYEEASTKFDTGQFDVLIANIYFSNLNKTAEALRHAERAVAKGNLDSPAQVMLFATFLAYDQKQYDKAGQFLAQAEPALKTDQERTDFSGLKAALEDARKRAAASDDNSSATPKPPEKKAPATSGRG